MTWPLCVLSPDTRALLDFLCAAHEHGCRVKRLNRHGLHARLRTLWRGNFIVNGTFVPSPNALRDWKQRRNQSDSSPPIAQAKLDLPPKPTAAEAGGGAAARTTDAPPPKLKKRGNPSMAERAQRFDAERAGAALGLSKKEARRLPDVLVAELSKAGQAEVAAAKERQPKPAPADAAGAAEVPNEPRPLSEPAAPPKRGYQRKAEAPLGDMRYAANREARPDGGQLADKLEAWCESSGASKIRLGMHLFGSAGGLASLRNSQRPKQTTIDRVQAFLDDPVPPEKLPQRKAKPVRAPRINPHYGQPQTLATDAVRTQRAVQKFKRSIRKQARAALDAGLTPAQASPNAGVRGAMKELRENDEAQRRATCPVELAKTTIRRRGFNCFDACVRDGEKKGKGHYYIGNRRVTEAELLAEAERMRG